MKKNFSPEDELLFLALGGSGEIGMNVNLYGAKGKWLMVDLGMTFSGNEYPGIDLVFADLEFIEERADDLLGIVITHAHEDHIGAVPYFAADLGVPIYATPFTAELVRRKLAEAGLEREVKLVIVEEDGRFEIGPFAVSYIPMAHSIAEANALLIETPHGRVFHTGDWKLDPAPQVGEPASEDELAEIGDDDVLAMVCDSTNVFNAESSGSEGAVYDGLLEEIQGCPGVRVMVTTFASNIARLQTLGRIARATGREVCVAGRSLDRMIEVAQDNSYLEDFPAPVSFDTAMKLPRGKLLIIATGGQGEPRAALSRVADKSHPLSLEAGDVVMFSSRQIPGNELAIGNIQNTLSERGIVMITDRMATIHVSGHPGRPELEALYGWIRPKVLIPVHGEVRHLQEHARLGRERGIPQAVFQQNGDVVRLAPGKAERVGRVAAGRLVLDGDIITPADGEAVTMRRRLSRDGLVIVILGTGDKAMIEGIGLPLDEDYDDFVADAQSSVVQALSRLKGPARRERGSRIEAARLAARRVAQRWSGKKPQVRVILPE